MHFLFWMQNQLLVIHHQTPWTTHRLTLLKLIYNLHDIQQFNAAKSCAFLWRYYHLLLFNINEYLKYLYIIKKIMNKTHSEDKIFACDDFILFHDERLTKYQSNNEFFNLSWSELCQFFLKQASEHFNFLIQNLQFFPNSIFTVLF